MDLKVFGVTGLPGSGKSIISRIAKREGIYTINMGDVIREEAERNNISTGQAAVNLRKKYGDNVVAYRCVKKIKHHSKNSRYNKKTTVKKIYYTRNDKKKPKKYKKIQQDVYIIEGIRSPQEVYYFRKHFRNFKVIAIHSDPESRFNRLKRRQREDDSPDYRMFQERDRRELKFGIGNVIALSDYMLINEGPIQNFKNNVRTLIINEIKPRNNHHKNKNHTKQNRKSKKGRKYYKKSNNKRYNNKQRR